MEWSRVLLAFALPVVLWALTFFLLAIQLLFLLFFETRITSSLIDKKFLDGLLATFIVAATSQYDRGVVAPLLASFYPKDLQEDVRHWILFTLGGMSLLMTGVAFHYSITHVTSFKGRSLLIFPSAVYEKDPPAVRKLWLRIFNLINLTSMVYFSVVHVYLFSLARVVGKVNNAGIYLAYIAGASMVLFAAQPIRSAILRFPSNLVLVAKVNQILAQNAKPLEVRRSLSTRKSDPVSWARRELLHVSRMLERLARQEDSVSGPGVPHPLAAIYRAVADEIRQYCGSPESLEGSLPSKLISTLKQTQGIMITGDSAWRKQLVKRLNVFDANKKPRVLATAPAPASAVQIFRLGGRYADLTLVWIKNRWPALIIVIGVVAFFLGSLDLKSLLQLAP